MSLSAGLRDYETVRRFFDVHVHEKRLIISNAIKIKLSFRMAMHLCIYVKLPDDRIMTKPV